jgi:hypothetical protein
MGTLPTLTQLTELTLNCLGKDLTGCALALLSLAAALEPLTALHALELRGGLSGERAAFSDAGQGSIALARRSAG